MYGSDFAAELSKGHALDFLFKLAEDYHTVCLPGEGFAGPTWSLRVALANINEADCTKVEQAITGVMRTYKKAATI